MPFFRNLTLAALVALLPVAAGAQLRPSVEGEVLVQWSNDDDSGINAGWLHGAVLISTPIVQGQRLSWVASGQLAGTIVGRGEDADCYLPPDGSNCIGHVNFTPRGALLSGVAYRDSLVVVRAQGGVARYEREELTPRYAPQLRLDIAFPSRSRAAFTMSGSHSWLGDFFGSKRAMTAVGVGVRVTP